MELPNRLGSAEQRVGSSALFRNRLPTWLGGERSGNLSSGEVLSAPEVTSSGNPETPQVRRERRRAMFRRASRQDTVETDSSEPLSRSTSAIRLASSSSALVTSAEQRVGSSSSFRNRLPTWFGGERPGNLSSGEVPSAPEVTSSGNPETPQARRERRRAMFSRAKRQDTGGTDSSELQSSPTSAIRLASSSSALVTSAERRVGSSSSVERKVGSDSQIYKQPHEYAQIKDVAQRI